MIENRYRIIFILQKKKKIKQRFFTQFVANVLEFELRHH